MDDNKKLGSYLLFIKNSVAKKVWIQEVREDIQQEVFIKLFKKGFFDQHDLVDGKISPQAGGYIASTVDSCFYDHVLRKKYKKRSCDEGDEYIEKIPVSPFEDCSEEEDFFSIPANVSIEAKEALDVIKKCFENFAEATKDKLKATFFEAAFWRRNYLDMSVKELAENMGFIHSNPTQEFNRFLTKVSGCTEKQDVILSAPNDQIEILLQLGANDADGLEVSYVI